MRLARRIALNDSQLDEVNQSIVIRRIETGTPRRTVKAVNRMGRFGQRILTRHTETLECVVSFAIDRPKRDQAGRRSVLDAVNTWAVGGGWVTCTERPDRRMWADEVILPEPGDLWDWTGEYTITFRAYSVPYWQRITPITQTEQNVSGRRTIVMPIGGNMPTVVNANITNNGSDTVNSFSIKAGGNTISLSEIGLEAQETLEISHRTDGLMQIKKGNTSLYDKRSAQSADDLVVEPGQNEIVLMVMEGVVNVSLNVYERFA